MKKTITFFTAIFAGFVAFSQVAVTYRVDVSDYIQGGTTIDATGIRVAGNFSTNIGTVGGAPMAEWSPTATACGMTDMGNNIWTITVNYPANSVGQLQKFKFFNGNWGANEGTAATNTILSANCGITDGTYGTVRVLEIPGTNTTITFCWDNCTAVCGANLTEKSLTNVLVYPNPTSDLIYVSFDNMNASAATFSLVDLTGKVIMTNAITAGVTNEINAALLNAGSYIYTLTAGSSAIKGKIIKN